MHSKEPSSENMTKVFITYLKLKARLQLCVQCITVLNCVFIDIEHDFYKDNI